MVYFITVDMAIDEQESVDLAELERVLAATLRAEDQPEETGMSLLLVDDDAIRTLNRDYRGVDSATDVLAFPTAEGESLVQADEAPKEIGDVVISLTTARRQAEAMGHSVEAELALLAIHGSLHLLGYDHGEIQERTAMWARQDGLLKTLGYTALSENRTEKEDAQDDG